MGQVELEGLARVVVLGDLGPVEVCEGMMESADRRCSRPAAVRRAHGGAPASITPNTPDDAKS